MANELRVRANGIGGLTEDNPLTNVATTLTSAGLSAVPVIGTTQHMAIILDPDGINGAPEIAYITAHTAAATTATIVRAQEGSTARAHDRDIPWVHGATVKDFDASGGGSGLIGYKDFRPAGTTVAQNTTDTATDVDATNLVVTFIAPPSGKVLVRLHANAFMNSFGSGDGLWLLRDASGDVANTRSAVCSQGYFGKELEIPVSGLTPGTSYTYKWGHANGGAGTVNTRYGGTNYGSAVMQVWAVNV